MEEDFALSQPGDEKKYLVELGHRGKLGILGRDGCSSVEDLCENTGSFITYYNLEWAEPFK